MGIRDLLKSVTRRQDDPKDALATLDRVGPWVRGLPRDDPAAAAVSIVSLLHQRVLQVRPLQPERLAATLRLDRLTEWAVSGLTTQYVANAVPGGQEQDLLVEAAELISSYTDAYTLFLRQFEESPRENAWRPYLALMLVRLLRFLRADCKLRLMRYERWIPAKWREVHRIFRIAIEHGCAEERVKMATRADPEAWTSVMREYLDVMLLHRLDSGNLSSFELEWAARRLTGWVEALDLRLTAEPQTSGGFIVDLDGTAGFERRDSGRQSGHLLYFNPGALEAAIDKAKIEMEARLAKLPSSERERILDAGTRVALLGKLFERFAVEAPGNKRVSRTNVQGQARVVLGMEQVCLAVKHRPDFLPQRGGDTNHGPGFTVSFGDTLQFQIGKGSASPIPSLIPVGRTVESMVWQLHDRSSDGIGFLAPAQQALRVPVGSLVAIRIGEERQWVIGIVRRLRQIGAREATVGVEVIARNLLQVQLQAFTPTEGGLVETETVSTNPRNFYGLYLPADERSSKRWHKTLILPRDAYSSYDPEHPLTLVTEKYVYSISLRRPLERQADWVSVSLEIRNRRPTNQAEAAYAEGDSVSQAPREKA
ncbi:hypothetical protein BURK2_00787 [Burkholderiales bacterium]|nr:hypothetical protein BURK2_00787 [Burkholderiales bacterium]